MEANRAELLQALKAVRPGLASKELVEQSNRFGFLDGSVVTYNDMISVCHPLPSLKGLTGAISAEELYSFVDRSKQETISFEVVEGELRAKSGRAKIGLKLAAQVTFPLDELKSDTDWAPLPPDFLDGLRLTLYSCSRDSSMPSLTCIHIQGAVLESTDNIRLTRYVCEHKLGSFEILLPAKSAEELTKYVATQFSINSKANWAHFLVGEGTVFSCRLLKSVYPDLSKTLAVRGTQINLPKKVIEVMDRAGVFSKRDHSLDQEVEVSLEARRMLVKAKSDVGWYEEEVGIRYEGENADFSVHPGFLADACDREAACTLSTNRMKFQTNKWEHVIALRSKG